MKAAVVAKGAALANSQRAPRMALAQALVERAVLERDRMATLDPPPGDLVPLLDGDRPRLEAVVRSTDAIAPGARHAHREGESRDERDGSDFPRSSSLSTHLTSSALDCPYQPVPASAGCGSSTHSTSAAQSECRAP